jgi:PEGA domain
VKIDGAYAGTTPLAKKEIAPGQHELRLVNEEKGVKVTRKVNLEQGKTTKLNLNLESP